jgi:uncharacterized protein (TIGR02757 family)
VGEVAGSGARRLQVGFLDRLNRRYGAAAIDRDPVSLVRRYKDRSDREAAGLIASGLAFGGVVQIRRSVTRVLRELGPRPARRIETGRLPDLEGFRHRWVDGADVALLLAVLRRILRGWGSIQAFVLAGDAESDPGARLSSFSRRAKVLAAEEGMRTRGFDYLFPEPARGGAAKRLCLLFRWMVRPDDGVDLGVWSRLDPASLVIPLDTHVHRIARYIGLTARRTAGWATAVEITRGLARFCPEDPVKYDFAIAQLGISRDCRHRRDPTVCPACPLDPVCGL